MMRSLSYLIQEKAERNGDVLPGEEKIRGDMMAVFKCLKDCQAEEGVEESYVVLKGRIKTKGEKVTGKSFQFKKKKKKAKAKTLSNEESHQQIHSTRSQEGLQEGILIEGQARGILEPLPTLPFLTPELLNVVWFELALRFLTVVVRESVCVTLCKTPFKGQRQNFTTK